MKHCQLDGAANTERFKISIEQILAHISNQLSERIIPIMSPMHSGQEAMHLADT